MNKSRRKEIDEIIKDATELGDTLEMLKGKVEDICAAEQEYLDNFPDNLQQSSRYEAAERTVEQLEVATDWFECVDCQDLITALESAKEG